MFITVKLKSIAKPAAALCAAALFVTAVLFAFPNNAKSVIGPYSGHTLLIDAGHGGVDGGAVSSNGLKESDVNLSVALKMSGLCELMGIEHKMTRNTDAGCLEAESYSEHNDLAARADMANAIDNCVLISVHQNKYPSELVRGAEVMYASTQGSRELGLLMQDNMVRVLDPENRRVAHGAPEELLLTSSVSCPAVLAECGFLSNPQEAALLADADYQTKIAVTLVASYIQFICQRL